MNIISKNFELRYISGDTKANGETDFKGETSVLNTEQRIDFLNEYARAMKDILGDVSLDTEIVTLNESKERLGKIKPQPVPQKRRRIILDTWKHIGFGGVKRNVGLKNGRIETQDFRCLIEWSLQRLWAADAVGLPWETPQLWGLMLTEYRTISRIRQDMRWQAVEAFTK